MAEEITGRWFCYMVRCADRSLYVGVATDVGERIKEHNLGVGATFTAKRRPVSLVWQQRFENQRDARERERELKGWRREKKLRLIREFQLARGGHGDS
ncbi:MAG TPA: GIY-YIG nuclease family protein [Candidatus Acidoferrales bacterium]